MRIRKDYTAPNGYWVLSDETRYVYDGMLVVQERYSSGVPRFAYSRGQDLSGSLQGAGGIGGMLARSSGYSSSTGGWGYNYTYHADGGGNITYAVASNGTKMAEYRYDSFGRTLSVYEQRAFTGNRYRFSSKEVHVRSGMYYYGYRFYDPYTQRWLNRDPIQETGGLNLFSYALNNPKSWYDFMGLKAGDSYPSMDAAGVAALDEICGRCIKDDLEYCGKIYQNPDGSWSYTEPKPGSPHSCASLVVKIPGGAEHKANYHCHGAYSGKDPITGVDYHDEEFSRGKPGDIYSAWVQNRPEYLVTPSGTKKKYTPSDDGPGAGRIETLVPPRQKRRRPPPLLDPKPGSSVWDAPIIRR